MGRKEMSLRRAVAILSFIGTDDFGREVFVDELGTIWKYTEPGPMPRERHDKLYTASSNGRMVSRTCRCPMRSTTRLSTRRRNTMSAVYRTLYEKYEQNDVLHVGIQEVVEAEKEIDTFLKSLDRDQRDQLDTLLGRLSRAYEMQGFLFGGLASGAKWNGKTAPEPGDGYGRSVRAYHGSTLAPVCQIDRKTNQVIHEYPSIAAASRATGLDDSAIGKVCKGKLPHAGGFLFRYIEQ